MERQQRCFKVAFPKNGGTARWMVLTLANRERQDGRWLACLWENMCKLLGPLIPFEAKVSYKPISSKDQSRLHQFGKKLLARSAVGSVFTFGRTVS